MPDAIPVPGGAYRPAPDPATERAAEAEAAKAAKPKKPRRTKRTTKTDTD